MLINVGILIGVTLRVFPVFSVVQASTTPPTSSPLESGDTEMATQAMEPRLKELVMDKDKCLGVTDMGLVVEDAVECPELERLSVKWCRDISDMGVELLTKCPDLSPQCKHSMMCGLCSLRKHTLSSQVPDVHLCEARTSSKKKK